MYTSCTSDEGVIATRQGRHCPICGMLHGDAKPYVLVAHINGEPLPGPIYLSQDGLGTDIPERARMFASREEALRYARTRVVGDPTWQVCGITLEPEPICA